MTFAVMAANAHAPARPADEIVGGDVAEMVRRVAPVAHAFAGKTIVVSGAAGFLGRQLASVLAELNDHVLEEPCRMIGLDKAHGGATSGRRDWRLVTCDVTAPLTLDERVDFVVHLAGIPEPRQYGLHPLETIEVATTGTRNVLDLARASAARVLFTSSSEVYGDPAAVPTPETYRGLVESLGPRACYDNSKRLGETLCWVFHDKFGVDSVIVRPFNVFGPGMAETDERVLPSFARSIAGNRPLRIFGTGNQTRTYCYVVDAIVGMFLALVRGRSGQAYNIGNSAPELSVLELADRLGRHLGRPLERVIVARPESYPGDEPSRRCPDLTKSRDELGYAPAIDLDEGLNRFLAWFRLAHGGARR